MAARAWQFASRVTARHPPLVLMYHALADKSEAPSRYVLPAQRFIRQMAWLRARRYRFLALDDLAAALHAGAALPDRSVVVTVDDAYTDFFHLGLPVLARLAIPATVFAVSERVGLWNHWEPVGPLAQRPMADWRQIRAMEEAGLRIGAHSRSHASLPGLSDAEADAEITGSKHDLERALGHAVNTFAYPHGHTSPSVRQLAREAGFSVACGVRPEPCGPAAPLDDLPRVEVQGTWRLLHLALAVWFGHVPARLAH